MISWVCHVACKRKEMYPWFWWQHLKKTTLKTRCRQENKLEMDLQDTGSKGVNRVHMAQERKNAKLL
jgi:hypothetical protein